MQCEDKICGKSRENKQFRKEQMFPYLPPVLFSYTCCHFESAGSPENGWAAFSENKVLQYGAEFLNVSRGNFQCRSISGGSRCIQQHSTLQARFPHRFRWSAEWRRQSRLLPGLHSTALYERITRVQFHYIGLAVGSNLNVHTFMNKTPIWQQMIIYSYILRKFHSATWCHKIFKVNKLSF